MRKLLISVFAVLLAFLLVACGNGGSRAEITLSYAAWGDLDFDRLMLDEFEKAYPHIEVVIRDDITGAGAEFTGNLLDAAQAGILPDVFATDNVPTIVKQDLTLDISDLWDADADAALVYPNVAETAVYNGKRHAVPSFQFIKGIMINLTIFREANLTTNDNYRIDQDGYPVKNWTFDEFIAIARDITHMTSSPETTVVGLDTWYGAADFQQVWPMMNDVDIQYDTWDGESFHYTSTAWQDAMRAKVALDRLTDGTVFSADLVETYEFLDGAYISSGNIAMDIEGSWQFPQINVAADNDIELGFWPYPSGSEGLFPPTILDYQAVSADTRYPEEAFLLAKWMTFGKDGWDARLTLLENAREAAIDAGERPDFLIGFPVADYAGHAERIAVLIDGIPGLQASLDRMEFAKPDLDKWLPGYKEFWAWANDPENQWNYANLLEQGPDSVAAFAQQWNTAVNQFVSTEMSALGLD